MKETTYILAELYNKMMNGTATDADMALYNNLIAISCIQKDVLIEVIKEKAREIETKRINQLLKDGDRS